jgi:hypothetical protein
MYTENDIILGIFRSHELAYKAKETYISYIKDSDPHAKQAYMKVSLENDVDVVTLDYTDPGGNTIYIYLEEADAFGQVTREIIHISSNLEYPERTNQECNEFLTSIVYNCLEVEQIYFENEDMYMCRDGLS